MLGVSLFWLSRGLMGARRKAKSPCAGALTKRCHHGEALTASRPALFLDVITFKKGHRGGGEKFIFSPDRRPRRRHATSPPDRAGCGVGDAPAAHHCFVSSHLCFEVRGCRRGAIIQLNSARGKLQLCGSRCTNNLPAPSPPTPLLPISPSSTPSSGINRHMP